MQSQLSEYDINFNPPTVMGLLSKSHYKVKTAIISGKMMMKVNKTKLKESMGHLPELYTIPEVDTINIDFESFFPENFDYDPVSDTFITGSTVRGSLFRVDMQGNVSTFTSDPPLSGYPVSSGIEIDASRRLVLVCLASKFDVVDPTVDGAVAAYQLDTGERLFLSSVRGIDPEGDTDGSTLGDITIAENGFGYVTDCTSERIFRVNLTNGKVELETKDPLLQRKRTDAFPPFHLHGMEYLPVSNELLIGSMTDGTLIKYQLETKQITFVDLPEPILGDGYFFLDRQVDDRKILIISSQTTGTIYRLESDNGWKSAKITNRRLLSHEIADVTSPTVRKGEIWQLRSGQQAAFTGNFHRRDFKIQRIHL